MNPFPDQERFRELQEVAIPITDLRIRWIYAIGKRILAGLSVQTSRWRQVPLPPGTSPTPAGDEVLYRGTLEFLEARAVVRVHF